MMTGMPPPPIGGPPPHPCPPPPGDIETDRKIFFERLTAFNEERGYSNNTSPTISKQPLDLHLLYNTVRARGGFIEVSRQKLWKECASICNLTINSSAAYTLKKQYIKHLLPFECKFDRGDADVNTVISQSEAATKSNSKKAQAEAARAAKSAGGRDGSAPSPGPGGADSNSQGSISSASTSSYGTGGDRDSSSASRSTPGPQQHPPPPLPSPGVMDGSSPRMDSPYGPPRIPSHPPPGPPGVGPYHHPGYNTSQQPPPPPQQQHHPYGPPPPHHLQGPPPMTGHHPGYGGYGPPPPPHHQQSQHPGYGHPPPPHHDQSIGGWPQHHQPPAPPHSGYGAPPPHSMPSGPQQHRPYPGPQGGESITAQDPFSDEAQQQHQQQPNHPGHPGYGQPPPPPPVNGYSGQQQYRHPAPPPTGQYSQQPPPPRGYPDYRQQPQPDNRAYGPQQGPPPSQPPQQPGDQSSSQSRYPPSQPAPLRPSPTTTPQPGSGPPGPVTSQQQPPSSTTPSSHSPYPPSHQPPPPHYTSGGKPAASQQHYPPPPSSSSPYGPPPPQQPPTSVGFAPPPSNQGMMRYPRPPGPPPPPTSSSQQQPHQQMPPPPPPPPVSSQSPSSDQSQSSHYPQGPPLHHHPTSGGKPAAAAVHASYPTSTSYATSHSSYPGHYGQGYGTPPTAQQHPGYGPPPPPHHDQSSWSQHPQQPGYGPPTPGHQTMPPPPPPPHHRPAPHSQTPPNSGAVGQSGETVSAQDPFGDDNQQGQSSNSSVPPPPTSYGQPPVPVSYGQPQQPPPRPVNGYPGQQYSSQPPPGHPSTMMPPSNVYNQSRSYGDYRDTARPPFGGHLPPPSDQSRYPPPGHAGGPPRAAPPIAGNQGHPSHGPAPHHPYPHSGGKPAAYGGQPSPYGQHHPPQGPPQHPSMYGPRDPSGMRYPRPPVPHAGHGGPPPHHLPAVGPSGHPLPYQPPGVGPGAGFHPSVGGGMGPGGPPLASIIKKEMSFPPGSVEATQPVFVKRRRVTSRDISQIEAWRLLMCLKSGLLAESTWALDVLSVLAYDDSTTNCFVLSGMPGLLDTILEHFKKYLGLMFSGIFEEDQGDLQLGQEQKKILIGDNVSRDFRETANSSRSSSPTCQRFKIRKTNNRRVRKWYQIDEDVDDVKENSEPPFSVGDKFLVNGELSTSVQLSNLTLTEKEISPAKSLKAQNLIQTLLPLYSADSREGRLVLLNGSVNYSMKTRDGKSVKIVNCKNGLTSGDVESRWKKLLWSTTTTSNPPSSPTKNSGKKSSNDGKVTNSGGHSNPSGGKNNEASSKSKGLPSLPNEVVAKQRIDCVVDEGEEEDWDPTCHILTTFAPKEKIIRFVRLTEPSSHKSKEMETEGDDLTISSPSSTVTKLSDLNGAKLVNGIKKEPDEKGQDKIDIEVTQEKETITYPRLLSKRKRQHDLFDDLEEEAFHKDHPPLYPIDDYLEQLGKRCLALSTLLRNFSFVPQNEPEMARHQDLLMVLSRLMLLNHEHPPKVRVYQDSQESKKTSDADSLFNEDPVSPDIGSDLTKTTEEVKDSVEDSQDEDFGGAKDQWYWEIMHLLLENTLVTLANISGQLDVSPFPEEISLPLLDGLLHWAVCPSSYAQDHLPLTSLVNLSPQRLALETLVKLSIRDCNVDLILATPPWQRLDLLFKNLTKMLARNEDQTLREFSLVLLVNLTLADSAMARAVALTGNAIPQLISFVEQSEQSALSVAQTHGINALRENPELMGTTLDMVRRAAICLRTISRIPENRPLFHIFQQRILNLVMSQILDQGVAAILADVMYECSLSDPTLTATKEVFLPYINVFATSGNLVTSNPPPTTETTVAPIEPAVTTNSSSSTVTEVKGEPIPSESLPPSTADHHVMSTPQQQPASLHSTEAPIVNGTIVAPSITESSNGDEKERNILLETHSPSSQPSSQQSISPLVAPIKQIPSQQAIEEDVERKIVVVNGIDGPKLNHQINNATRGSPVPPVVQPQPSNSNNSAVAQQAPNNNDPSRGCPRLKELLLSYQMSPRFDGQNSSSSGGHEQQTEQISS